MDSFNRLILLILYILVIIIIFIIIIISIIQMKKGFGFKNILSIINNFIINFEKNNEYCNGYISEIKLAKRVAKAKTLFNLSFNLFQFIYSLIRLKNVNKFCRIGFLIWFILIIGHIAVIALTSIAIDEYNVEEYNIFVVCFSAYQRNKIIEDESFKEEENNSNYVKILDFAIIGLNCFPFLFFLCSCPICLSDCDSSDWFNEDFFFVLKLIDNCIRIPQIKRHNDKLKEENNYLRISQKNLRDEIMDLKRQKNINNNIFNTERKKLKNEILVIRSKNFKKFKHEKNLSEELDNLKENNNNLGKEIEKLKNSKQVIYKDLEKI